MSLPPEKPDQPAAENTENSGKAKESDIKINPVIPDNTELYRRTQALFKKRKKHQIEQRARRQEGKEPIKKPTVLELPIPKPREIYRPPSYLTGRVYSCSSERVCSSAGSSSKTKFKPKATVTKPKFKKLAQWPPPKDTNYLKLANQVPKTAESSEFARVLTPDSPESCFNNFGTSFTNKFVDCELCGKKNLSSFKQLQVHQASKKCRNRREHFSDHRCTVCQVKFDTRHNLLKHKCRLN